VRLKQNAAAVLSEKRGDQSKKAIQRLKEVKMWAPEKMRSEV